MSAGNIFLVGLMGAGKTTIGRTLARRLNKRFIDSDHEIEARTGASIAWIFEIEGEANFRRREADVIRDLVAQDGIVLATGGGAILDPESRRLLHERGTVVYLRSNVNAILARTAHDRNRPLLQTANPRQKLEELSAQRDPLYRQVAHITVESARPEREGGRPDAARPGAARPGAARPNVQSVVQAIINQLAALDAAREKAGQPMQQAQTATTLEVALGERSYPIVVGPGVLGQPLLAGHVRGTTAAIVTNETVAPLYLEQLAAPLRAAGKEVFSVVLPDGERYKDWASLMKIYDALLANKCDRKTTVVALGGGVVGDMAGFAAATYMRGVPFVQVPTTLLAQVDSSVGGKTGINHPLGKNMIGAFYQPAAVLADTATLATLPGRELSAGLAEVIKHGAIADRAYFDWVEANIGALRARDPAALVHAVLRSCEIKADVVRQDERETGLRAILNFGHTFGHAIEAGLGFGTWLHGEAVGCGMVMAADLSARLGHIDGVTVQRIRALVAAAGLPVRAPDLGAARWLELMELDKKSEAGQIRFVLLKPLGSAVVEAVPSDALAATIAACTR